MSSDSLNGWNREILDLKNRKEPVISREMDVEKLPHKRKVNTESEIQEINHHERCFRH
jgi:hypothetical protein